MIEPYYQEASGVIYHADCLEIMRTMPDKSVDLILTDPPYRDEKENQPTKDMRTNGGMDNFGSKPSQEYFDEIFRVSKAQIIFGANNFQLPPYKGFIVYKKKTISLNFTMSMAEIAYLSENLGTISKVIEFAPQGDRYHPTQKPIELMRWCLENYSKEGDFIFDPFCGSGTVGRACKDMGRKFIQCEKIEKYCEISKKRLQQQVLDFKGVLNLT